MSELPLLSSPSSPGYCIANGTAERGKQKTGLPNQAYSLPGQPTAFSSCLPLSHSSHADRDDGEEIAVGPHSQGKQLR